MAEELKQHGERIFKKSASIDVAGRSWDLNINQLATQNGISVNLREASDRPPEERFLLDYSDIVARPGEARMHMFNGVEKRVPFEEKLRRMELWAASIQAYDSLMKDVPGEWGRETALEYLRNLHLPRLQTVIADTGTAGLIKLFESIGFPMLPEPPHPFSIPWAQLVQLSESGKFVDAWRKLKDG